MDWFERLTGFRESNYAAKRARRSSLSPASIPDPAQLDSTIMARRYRTGAALQVTQSLFRTGTGLNGIGVRKVLHEMIGVTTLKPCITN